MSSKLNLYLSLLTFIILLNACENETINVDPAFTGKQFFPTIVGKYIIYQYDSIVLDNEGSVRDTQSGFLKEEITGEFTNSQEEKGFNILKSWKRYEADSWRVTNAEVIYQKDKQTIVSYGNLNFIKMVYPNQVGTEWDGNALFDNTITVKIAGEPMEIYSNWNYIITDRDVTLSYPSGDVNTITVEQVDDENALTKRYAIEIYGEDIGLVERNMIIYDSQNYKPGQAWETFAQAGFTLHQKMIEHN